MFLVGIIFRKNSIIGLQYLKKKDVRLFMLGGLFQPFLYYILETYTYHSFSSPTISEALLSTNPLFAPIFAWLFLKERVTKYNIMGICISTGGMFLLLLSGSNNFEVGNSLGIPLGILAVSTAIFYSIILQKIPSTYSSLSIVFYVQLFSLFLFYPLWGVIDMPEFITGNIHWNGEQIMNSLLSIAYLSILASVTAFILFCYTVRKIGVTLANTYNNIRPAFTALIMWITFNEHLPIWKWIGIILIIVGLFICKKQNNKQVDLT